MRIFIKNCQIEVQFFANNISNAIMVEGKLPRDSQKMIDYIQYAILHLDEDNLKEYRSHIQSF